MRPLVRRAWIVLVVLIIGSSAVRAQTGFEEGDWLAWPDTRTITTHWMGNEVFYFGTIRGVLRWDRMEQSWMTPWYSVPGDFDHAHFLFNVQRIVEDPITRDVYVKANGEWYVRNFGYERWSEVETIPELTLERVKKRPKPEKADKANIASLFVPFGYNISIDGELTKSLEHFPLAGSVQDPLGPSFYWWEKIGFGVASQYNPNVTLYPGGPGPVHGFGITDEGLWCAASINRDGGWVWFRNWTEDVWQYFDPNDEFGLEPGDVNSLSVGKDGSVWIATHKGVMAHFDRSWHHYNTTDRLPSERIFDVEPVKDGAWVATRFGLAFIDRKAKRVSRPDPETEAAAAHYSFSQVASRGDTLYAAAPGVLLRRNPSGVWEEIEGSGNIGNTSEPTALYLDDEVLAIGDQEGFAYHDGDEWHTVYATRWERGAVFDIDRSSENIFWLGTDEGLVKFDPKTGKTTLYDQEEGLPGRYVFDVELDGDWIWLGTDKALVRFLWNSPNRID